MSRRHYSTVAEETTISSGITSSGTSITVAALTGYPSSTPWTAILEYGTTNQEVVEVTGVAGTTLTVTRGVDGTTGVSHSSGATLRHGVSARDMDEPNAFLNNGGSIGGGVIPAFLMENWNVAATAATGTVNVDVLTAQNWYYTSNASANWTFNFRGSSGTSLDSTLATGDSVTVTFAVTNGATAYFANAFTIDGSSVTPKWQGAYAISSPVASAITLYQFTILKTGSATFTVFGSYITYG